MRQRIKNRKPMGATVTAMVSDELVGEALRRLEHHAEIFLLDRHRDPHKKRETWTLRSDQFPTTWEGGRVSLSARREGRGFADIRLEGRAEA